MPSDIFSDDTARRGRNRPRRARADPKRARVRELEGKLFQLHTRDDSHERAVQYEIVCVQIELCDLRGLLANTPGERAGVHADRHKFAEQQRQLLKLESKDRYVAILRAQERIERAGDRLAPLVAAQRDHAVI